MATLTYDQKLKVYWQVFFILFALTIFELGIVFAPIPQLAITLLVVTASMAKAFIVGWVYMHLNHETVGLKVILLFPLFVAFFYAVGLITDTKVVDSRKYSEYVGQPKRFFGQRKLNERKVDDFGNTVPAERAATHMVEGDSASASSVSSAGGTQDSGTLPAQAGTVGGSTSEAAKATEQNRAAQSSASSEAAKH